MDKLLKPRIVPEKPNRMEKIDIVTVLYNSREVLPDFFRSLDRQSYRDFRLYVVDNASLDQSLA